MAEALAERKETRERRRERRGRERIVWDSRALRERYGVRAESEAEVKEVGRRLGWRGVGRRVIFFG